MGVATNKAAKAAASSAAREAAGPTTAAYTVLCDEFRTHGEAHAKGATVSLSAAEAKQALEVGAIEPVKKKAKDEA
jgi:hypothetical protein